MSTKEEAMEYLKDIPQGERVSGIIRSVAPSGMSRTISFVIPALKENTNVNEPYIRNITHLVAKVLGYKVISVNGQTAIRVSGCGMDMIFKVVYDLGTVLHDDGYYFKSAQL